MARRYATDATGKPLRNNARIIGGKDGALAMDQPPNTPLSNEEADGLAESAVLSGAAGSSSVPTDQEVTVMLGRYASSLYQTGLGGTYV